MRCGCSSARGWRSRRSATPLDLRSSRVPTRAAQSRRRCDRRVRAERQWIFEDLLDAPVARCGRWLGVSSLLAAETPASVFAALPLALARGYRGLVVGHEASANAGNLVWDATRAVIISGAKLGCRAAARSLRPRTSARRRPLLQRPAADQRRGDLRAAVARCGDGSSHALVQSQEAVVRRVREVRVRVAAVRGAPAGRRRPRDVRRVVDRARRQRALVRRAARPGRALAVRVRRQPARSAARARSSRGSRRSRSASRAYAARVGDRLAALARPYVAVTASTECPSTSRRA